MTIEIRDAAAADEDACARLLAELLGSPIADPGRFSEIFRSLLGGERGQVVVADEEGTILGMATVSFNLTLRHGGEYCQLEELIVSPAARGKNAGGRLVQAIVQRASERGCAEIGLYLVESTEHNRPFYAKYGFEAVGTELRQSLER